MYTYERFIFRSADRLTTTPLEPAVDDVQQVPLLLANNAVIKAGLVTSVLLSANIQFGSLVRQRFCIVIIVISGIWPDTGYGNLMSGYQKCRIIRQNMQLGLSKQRSETFYFLKTRPCSFCTMENKR